MHKLMHYYYQNRDKIWKIVLIVILIVAIIQLLNYMVIKNSSNKISQTNNISNNNEINKNTTTSNTIIKSNTSSVTGGTISSTKLQNVQEIINDFLENCNNGKYDDAYSLLTDDCKQEVYPSLEAFKNAYCLKIFDGAKKTFTIENWTGDTYKVRIIEDLLSTGRTNNGMATQDFITIVNDNGENKLNINSYIGKTEINNKTEKNGISVTIVSKNTYIEYETYIIQVKNNTEKTICLDPLVNTDKIYLTDSNGVNFIFYSYELLKDELIIKPEYTRSIKIKFTNGYTTGRKIKSLTFKNLILDYSQYQNFENKLNFKDFNEFSADL